MSNQQLELDEQQILREFRMNFQEEKEDSLTIPVKQLLHFDQLEDFLFQVQKELQAPNKMVAASIFAKRYSYLIVVPLLYSFSVLNKGLNGSVTNLFIEPSRSNEYWLPELRIMDKTVTLPGTKIERTELREHIVETIFSNHLNIIWGHLAKIGKLSKHVLWENTAIYLFWLYEMLLEKELPRQVRGRIIEDFNYIVIESGGSMFGTYCKNPLTTFYTDKEGMNGKEIRVRKTCCFSYETGSKIMCHTCPKNSR